MKTREQLVKSAAKQRGPIAGADAQRLLAHWLSNRTEIVITEAITGVLAHWSVFSEERGNGRPPKVGIPALSSVRGLSRDTLGFHTGALVKALHVRPARESRWNGRRALIHLERAQ